MTLATTLAPDTSIAITTLACATLFSLTAARRSLAPVILEGQTGVTDGKTSGTTLLVDATTRRRVQLHDRYKAKFFIAIH